MTQPHSQARRAGTHRRRAWLLLTGAVAGEVTGSVGLKAAIDEPRWYVLVVAGYVAAFALLALTLRAWLPLGVAYGAWGAGGVALTAVLATVLFGEPFTVLTAGGVLLIGVGVLLVETGSHAAAEDPT
ncbi:DMT family transporter [Nocardioides bruguierae]|uniref:SMR family transporter n=1 Tax=Nocardioides bruguierae TaxID=2945102 RepID=A0A9X2D894_9ACTN|nr:SMR family transporter [Nocardioides bruguierae]MCM0621180.1 SMR family transporter [Nocardioides bruguierae]